MTALVLAAGSLLAPSQPSILITRSRTMSPSVRLVPSSSEDGSSAAMVIRGNGITVDFRGMTLRGTPASVEPDQRKGTGVLIQGSNVTVKNLRVHGYKVGLFARGAKGLKILNCDFSYNWKQKLLSTLDKEDLADWMSYHQNEKNEWLRYGAGLYLDGCDGAEVRGTTIEGGQCGLMMPRTNRAKVTGNSFRFLSAIGLGMYRSSDCLVQQNRIDWCVRGYSHGVWNRGQDSAGILIYEQSSRNVFAYNSVTHGGDGFFLWAGQTTMDTGQGGCNDNLLVGNDFSHSPTNGIEATFSRNAYVNNLVLECWHGGWLGYSYETLVWKNVFGLNAQGIAWEHGQDNLIEDNSFSRDNSGISLWQNQGEDPDWGYAKKRDTASRDNLFKNNRFHDIPEAAISLKNTRRVTLEGCLLDRVGTAVVKDARAEDPLVKGGVIRMTPSAWSGEAFRKGLSPELSDGNVPAPRLMQPSGNVILGLDPQARDYLARFNTVWDPRSSSGLQGGLKSRYSRAKAIPAWLKGEAAPFIAKGALRGRRYILVDQWGPYDFKSPLLWPRRTVKEGTREVWTFEVLGPAGKWSLKGLTPGAKASASQGSTPGSLTVDFPADAQDLNVRLVYKGARTVDYRGLVSPAGSSVPFGFSRFRIPIKWQVRHFNYDSQKEDPRTRLEAWKARMEDAGPTSFLTDLNFAWGGSPEKGINADYFGTIAEGEVKLAPGDYILNVTSDDGVRVWIDGRLAIDNWTYHGPTLDTAKLGGGFHKIRIEHFELNGYAALKAEVLPVKAARR